MANRALQAKVTKMKRQALDAKLGNATRWGDPKTKPESEKRRARRKLLNATLTAMRAARKG